jgi:CDP-diacylglycerol--glycerol-3-phosphate 3-phosphatidyltransferase
MPLLHRSTLPNVITVGRIVMAPLVFFLIFRPTFSARLLAFILFLIAAFSDLWDGYLARKYGWISNFGKLLDPIADKLLVVVTFIPFYVLSHRGDDFMRYPFWPYEFPLWVMLVVFGREALVTVLRGIVARRGVVIPAGEAGKRKAVWQNIFIGSAIMWYALHAAARENGWIGLTWNAWRTFHAIFLSVTLLVALAMTVYSMLIYLYHWRSLVSHPT